MKLLRRALGAYRAAGVWPVTFLLACWFAAPAQAEPTGSVGISMTFPDGAPEMVYLLPKGRTNPLSSLGVIELPARQVATETAYYQVEAPPGDYLLAARVGDVFRPADPTLPALHVEAGVHADYGRVWVDGLGGDQWVLMRDSAAPANAELFQDLPRGASRGWDTPVGAQEQKLLDRARRRVVVPHIPVELIDGTWMAWSPKGGVLARDGEGQWRVAARLPASRRLAAAHALSATDYVLADEFGALYRGGAQVEQVGQLPPGRVISLQCNQALACAAVLDRDPGQVAVHARDAKAGGWTEVAHFPRTGTWRVAVPARAEALPGTTVVVFEKGLWSIDLASGGVRQAEIPAGGAPFVQAAGDVLLGYERYSRDGGLTWQKVETGFKGGLLFLGRNDTAWVAQNDIDLALGNPVLRRQAEGKWNPVGELPAPGGLRIGRASQVMYLADAYQPQRLWVSLDDGVTWGADRALQSALEAL